MVCVYCRKPIHRSAFDGRWWHDTGYQNCSRFRLTGRDGLTVATPDLSDKEQQ
jgi:hypothetical protein